MVNCDFHFPLDAITEGKDWLVNQEKIKIIKYQVIQRIYT